MAPILDGEILDDCGACYGAGEVALDNRSDDSIICPECGGTRRRRPPVLVQLPLPIKEGIVMNPDTKVRT